MGVDAEGDFQVGLDFGDDAFNLVGQTTAVGVAENDPIRSCLLRRQQSLQGIRGVAFVAVKEMLGVVDDFLAFPLCQGNGVLNHPQVFFQRDAQRLGGV